MSPLAAWWQLQDPTLPSPAPHAAQSIPQISQPSTPQHCTPHLPISLPNPQVWGHPLRPTRAERGVSDLGDGHRGTCPDPTVHPGGNPMSPHTGSPPQSPPVSDSLPTGTAACQELPVPWLVHSGFRTEGKQERVSQKIHTGGERILPGSQNCLARNGKQKTTARKSWHVAGHLRTRCWESGNAGILSPLQQGTALHPQSRLGCHPNCWCWCAVGPGGSGVPPSDTPQPTEHGGAGRQSRALQDSWALARSPSKRGYQSALGQLGKPSRRQVAVPQP